MKKALANLLFILLIFPNLAKAYYDFFSVNDLLSTIQDDYHAYYTHEGIPYLIAGLSVAGLLANSHLDEGLQHEWQSKAKNSFLDPSSKIIDSYASATQYPYSIPFFFSMWWLTKNNQNAPVNHWLFNWSQQSLRTLAIGIPQQAIFTMLLGGDRPTQGPSYWYWFRAKRAVSGHAFYGAVPLLNLAKMTSSPAYSSIYYVLSLLPALARIDDNKHYTSQVFLGWWLAFSATQSVWHAQEVSKKSNRLTIEFYPGKDSIYLGLRKII